jgi:phosphoserine phosphatase
MTENSAQSEQFTGLILLTGVDAPGIASSLFETLAPFAVHVIDIEQVVISNRLILTVLIGANPAHQSAIEEDLASCATALDVDIATLFGKTNLATMPQGLVHLIISAPKLHPRDLALTTQLITNAGANIQSFSRTSDNPVSIEMIVSGASLKEIESAITSLVFDNQTTISVGAR